MNEDPYRSVRNRLMLSEPLPVSPDWSAAPDFLHRIIDHCLEHRPSRILECSSGLTTLALARCCQMNKSGQVYSLENGADYAATTRSALERFGLQQYATVLHAPLQEVILRKTRYRWYSNHSPAAGCFDMLVVDGPPVYIQMHSRYPALPLLYRRLADDCTVFLDDAAREDEQEIIAMWLDEFPAFAHEYADLERGCAILRRHRR